MRIQLSIRVGMLVGRIGVGYLEVWLTSWVLYSQTMLNWLQGQDVPLFSFGSFWALSYSTLFNHFFPTLCSDILG